MGGKSDGVGWGSVGTTGLDGMRPVCTGAVIIASADDEGSSIARASDGMMLDVRGAEGMIPGGNDVRDAAGMRPVVSTDGAPRSAL